MLPRWHILLGGIFTLLFGLIYPGTYWGYLLLIFLASFLIDFDHYMNAVWKGGSFSLFSAFNYYDKLGKKLEEDHKRGIRRRSDFQIFHTLEFHIVVALLGFIWIGFWYILIGMIFHSLLDVISLRYKGYLYVREYLFFAWLINNI